MFDTSYNQKLNSEKNPTFMTVNEVDSPTHQFHHIPGLLVSASKAMLSSALIPVPDSTMELY